MFTISTLFPASLVNFRLFEYQADFILGMLLAVSAS